LGFLGNAQEPGRRDAEKEGGQAKIPREVVGCDLAMGGGGER